MDDDDDDHEKEFVSDLWASFQTSPISAFLVDECVSFTLADKLNEACRCNYNTATTAMGTMQWNFGMKTVKFRCVFLWDMVTYRQTDRQTCWSQSSQYSTSLIGLITENELQMQIIYTSVVLIWCKIVLNFAADMKFLMEFFTETFTTSLYRNLQHRYGTLIGAIWESTNGISNSGKFQWKFWKPAGKISRNFTSYFRRKFYSIVVCDVLPSVIDRLLLPAIDFGTVYLSTFSLLHHSQHFAKSWKLIYFGNPIPRHYYIIASRGVDPYGTGRHVPPIFMKGDIHGNVPQSFRSDVDSSDSNCCLLYFNANIMCCFTKKATGAPPLDTTGGLCPSDPLPGFHPWTSLGTSVPQTLVFFYVSPQ